MVKNTPSHAGDISDVGSIPGSGVFPGGGHGNPLQCSCLGNTMDRGAWQATYRRTLPEAEKDKEFSETKELLKHNNN